MNILIDFETKISNDRLVNCIKWVYYIIKRLQIQIYIIQLILLSHFRSKWICRSENFILFQSRQFALYVSILEPDSIVEKQGWEICWAKPIGVKNLDRQQHIREAVTNMQSSKLEKTDRSRVKAWHKKCIQMEIVSEDNSAYLMQMKILQDFVKEKFDATCIFDCVSTPDASGYVGTVSILI